MPQEFEQQARNILYDIEFEPHTKVWENIKGEIEVKDKNKISWRVYVYLFFALLIPIVMLNKTDSVSSFAIDKKMGETAPIYSAPIKKSFHVKNTSDLPQAHLATLTKKDKKYSNLQIQNTTSEQVFSATMKKNNNSKFEKPSFNQVDTDQEKSEIDNVMHAQAVMQDKIAIKENDIDPNFILSDNVKHATSFIPRSANMNVKHDQLSLINKQTDSANSKKVIHNKPGKEFKKIQLGYLLEAGKICNATSTNFINPLKIREAQISGGYYITAGINLEKKLNKSILLQNSFNYSYQFYYYLTSIDSIDNNGQVTNWDYFLKRNYHLHFAGVSTNILFNVLDRKKLNVNLSFGINNSFLLKIKKYKVDEGNFAIAAIPSNSSSQNPIPNNTSGYTWQPSISIGVPIKFYSSKGRVLQLAPIITYKMRRLEKDPMSNINKPFQYFGLQATYFLK